MPEPIRNIVKARDYFTYLCIDAESTKKVLGNMNTKLDYVLANGFTTEHAEVEKLKTFIQFVEQRIEIIKREYYRVDYYRHYEFENIVAHDDLNDRFFEWFNAKTLAAVTLN